MKIALNNQTLALLRNLISVPGVAKTAEDIYRDGELLCVVLPEQDLKWVKTQEDLAKMAKAEQDKYLADDKAWAAVPVELEMTEKQRDRVKAILSKVPELISVQQTKALFAVYSEFGFKPA